MNNKPVIKALAALLIVTLVAPAAFFIAPQRASASSVACVGGIIGGALGATASSLLAVPSSDALTQIETGATAGATIGTCINDVILIPLARMAIRAMLQQMTASVISWVNNTPGKGGTSRPSFVTNLSVNLQGVGDSVALSFISRVSTGFNSPFGSSISLALYDNYRQQSSLAGFFGANMNTLPGTLQSQRSFLNGNWLQGGVGSWFALTTRPENNPYTLYQAAQSQLGSDVGQAQANRRQDLLQSGGFMSWCGTSDNLVGELNAQDAQIAAMEASLAGRPSQGVNPGDSCTNDGVPGSIQTPGSIIHDYTQQAVVNSGFQQLISANDLDSMLGAVVSALLNKALGGVGGLLGASSGGTASNPSVVNRLQTFQSSSASAGQTAYQTAQTVLDRLTAYTTAWQTVADAANTASTSVQSLADFCTAAATAASAGATPAFVTAATAQATAARTALKTEILPVLTQALAAPATAASTQAFALKVQAESVGTSAGPSLAADVSALIAMPPSAGDATTAQTNASVTGTAVADTTNTLAVSRGTLVDQMNLIGTNAAALKDTVCDPNSSLYATAAY